jgi:hypothetical protein
MLWRKRAYELKHERSLDDHAKYPFFCHNIQLGFEAKRALGASSCGAASRRGDVEQQGSGYGIFSGFRLRTAILSSRESQQMCPRRQDQSSLATPPRKAARRRKVITPLLASFPAPRSSAPGARHQSSLFLPRLGGSPHVSCGASLEPCT